MSWRRLTLAGIPCDCVVAHGPTPSGVILREARVRNCDMIVMASHGRRGSGGLAGSETLKVVALGGIPVLVHHASRAAALRPLRHVPTPKGEAKCPSISSSS